MGMRSGRLVLWCALMLGGAFALSAQSLGTLHGQVTDPSGAVIPNATVTVTAPDNTVKAAETGSDGGYSIAGIAPGKYSVRITAVGFALVEKTDLEINPGRSITLDARLPVATDRQEVTVADRQEVQVDPAAN